MNQPRITAFLILLLLNVPALSQGYLQNDESLNHASGITLSEILPGANVDYNADGAVSSANDKDEFVEITNTSRGPIDVNGWQIADNNNYYTLEGLDPINPGSYLIIFTRNADISNFSPGPGNQVLVVDDLALHNENDIVALKNTADVWVGVEWSEAGEQQPLAPDWTFGDHAGSVPMIAHTTWAGQNEGRSAIRDFSTDSTWVEHPVLSGSFDWSVDGSISLENPSASPGREATGQNPAVVSINEEGVVTCKDVVAGVMASLGITDANGLIQYVQTLSVEDIEGIISAYSQDLKPCISNVTSLANLSQRLSGTPEQFFDLSTWDVSQVTDMERIFFGASTFNQDISKWDVSKVTNMSWMFKGATSFNQDIGDWDVSNVTTMEEMFEDASTFNKDIGNWNVSKVTDMSDMFRKATSFNQDIGDWDVSKVERFERMFRDATSFNQYINNWDVPSAVSLAAMFSGATAFNQDISSWDVRNVESMASLFREATSFNQDIGGWDVANVRAMNVMFSDATSFNQDLSDWCVRYVTAEPMGFNVASPLDESQMPVWGTCPRVPLTPIPILPVTDEVQEFTPQNAYFEWEGTENTTHYNFQMISGDSSEVVLDTTFPYADPGSDDVVTVSYSPAIPETGYDEGLGYYYWRTRAINETRRVGGGPAFGGFTELVRILLGSNEAPVASASASTTQGQAPYSIDFNASASTDPNGDALTFAWDFGDGATGSGESVSHTYTAAGEYTVVLTASDGHLTGTDSLTVSIASGVDTESSELPETFVLKAAYPNPFNPTTTITYGLPAASEVSITATDLLGRQVATLVAGDMKAAGYHTVQLNAGGLASGTYLIRMEAGDFVATQQVVLLK